MHDEGKIKSLPLIRIGRSVANPTKYKKTLTQICNENLVTDFINGVELR